MLDARLCGVQVERPVLDVAEDATGRLEKGLLHAVARLRRRLDEHEAVLVGELLRLLVGDVTLRLQVALVADEEDDGVRVRQVAGVRQPGAQVVVRGASRHIVDHQRASSSAVVAPGDSSESFLASGVPDLKLDLLSAHFDDSGAKLDANCVRTVGHEFLVSELVKQAGLAYAHITDDDVFEDVGVVVRARGRRHDGSSGGGSRCESVKCY